MAMRDMRGGGAGAVGRRGGRRTRWSRQPQLKLIFSTDGRADDDSHVGVPGETYFCWRVLLPSEISPRVERRAAATYDADVSEIDTMSYRGSPFPQSGPSSPCPTSLCSFGEICRSKEALSTCRDLVLEMSPDVLCQSRAGDAAPTRGGAHAVATGTVAAAAAAGARQFDVCNCFCATTWSVSALVFLLFSSVALDLRRS